MLKLNSACSGTQTPAQQYVQQQVQQLLGNLSNLFSKDELAFYSLQGKNERYVCSKIAYNLQLRLDANFGTGKYIVRVEWSPLASGRDKVDLAVLEVNANNNNQCNVIALLEFKVQQVLNTEDWFYAEFLKDVQKMYDIVGSIQQNGSQYNRYNQWNWSSNNVDLYFVFLQNIQNQNQKVGGYLPAVGYYNFLNSKNATFLSDSNCPSKLQSVFSGFGNNAILSKACRGKKYKSFSNIISYAPKYNPPFTTSPQSIGNIFGYDWYIAPMLWGPYQK